MSQIAQVHQWSMPEILDTLATHRQKLQTLGVRKLGLFGSYTRGTAEPESDMDFLVAFEDSVEYLYGLRAWSKSGWCSSFLDFAELLPVSCMTSQ